LRRRYAMKPHAREPEQQLVSGVHAL
jgi:hypothetical protein